MSNEKEFVEIPVGRKTKQELPLEQTVYVGTYCEEKKVFHTDQTLWFVVGKEQAESGAFTYSLFCPETNTFDKASREDLIVQRCNSDKTLFSVLSLVKAFNAGVTA